MKLEHSFEVNAPVGTVWETLIDVERVAPCLPGAEITQANDDGTYEGNFQVKLGPTTAAYTGKLSMESVDESERRATMKASGRDKRGQGSANATIVSTMHESGDGTRVDVETDFTITGRLARFGRGGMMQDISNRLLRDFAQCLRENLEADGDAASTTSDAAPAPGAEGAGAVAAAASGDQGASAAPGAAPSGQTGPAPASDEPPRSAPEPAPSASGQGAGAPPQEPTPSGAGQAAGASAQQETSPSSAAGAAGAAAGSGAAASAGSRAPMKPGTGSSQPAKPVQGISLVLGVLFDRLKRLIGRLRSMLQSRRR